MHIYLFNNNNYSQNNLPADLNPPGVGTLHRFAAANEFHNVGRLTTQRRRGRARMPGLVFSLSFQVYFIQER